MNKHAKKRPTRKEILRRRRREKRLYIVTAVFATLCVFAVAGVAILLHSSANDNTVGNWIVADSDVEIAAPEYNPGGLVVVETNRPDFPPIATAEPTTAPDDVSDAESTALPFEFTTPEPTATPEMPVLESETMIRKVTISAAGDCTLGGDYNSSAHERFDSYVAEKGYDYFLENVKSIFEEDDITFVNLEGPLTTSTTKRENRTYNFKGAPEYVQILTGSSVELAGLANNHALDFGTDGLYETAEVLDNAGVGYCGYGEVWRNRVNGVDVSCLSVTEWDYTVSDLKKMVEAERDWCDVLVVMIHWGEERVYDPTDNQVEYGHALIDAGADLVLGSHPHVVGAVEQYNGKYIVYSLGNFCFGGNKNPGDKDSMIFQQTFELNADGELVDAGISIIPCSISSVSNSNDYRPTPLADTEAARVLRKIGLYSNLDDSSVVWDPDMESYLALLD